MDNEYSTEVVDDYARALVLQQMMAYRRMLCVPSIELNQQMS